MSHTAHLFTGHGAMHLAPALRSLRRFVVHRLSTAPSPSTLETLLLAAATLLFVLACVGLTMVGASYAH
jgi:hypothetical protein